MRAINPGIDFFLSEVESLGQTVKAPIEYAAFLAEIASWISASEVPHEWRHMVHGGFNLVIKTPWPIKGVLEYGPPIPADYVMSPSGIDYSVPTIFVGRVLVRIDDPEAITKCKTLIMRYLRNQFAFYSEELAKIGRQINALDNL